MFQNGTQHACSYVRWVKGVFVIVWKGQVCEGGCCMWGNGNSIDRLSKNREEEEEEENTITFRLKCIVIA